MLAPSSIGQPAPPLSRVGPTLPAHAEKLLERSSRFTKLPLPGAIRDGAHRDLEVLTAANAYEPGMDDWEHFWRTTHTYNGLLRHFSTRFVQQRGPGLIPNDRAERSYDAQNRLTEVRHDQWEGDDFAPNWRTQYTYTGFFQVPVVMTSQWYDGETWHDSDRDTFVLSEDGTYFTSGQRDWWKDGAWVPYDRFSLANVEGGTTYTTELWTGDTWVYEERAVVPNLTAADLVQVLMSVSDMEEEFQDLFLPASLIPDHTFEMWDGGAWIPTERQVSVAYHQPQTGALTRVEATFEAYSDGAWEPDSRLVSTYDLDDDELIDLLEIQYLEGEEWLTLIMETYDHTETSRLNSAEQALMIDDGKQADGGGPIPFPFALYTYEWEEPPTAVENPALPIAFGIDALYPNPVISSGVVRYHLQQATTVALEVFDVLGRRVAVLSEGAMPEGAHEARLEASALPSGYYFIRLLTPSGSVTRRLTVLH